jgi:dipeptidyl-peptidase 4
MSPSRCSVVVASFALFWGASPLCASSSEAERVAAAEAFMPGNVYPLITDLNMSARFIAGDKVLYRRGPHGTGEILLADPATGLAKVLVREADLKPKLIAAGAKLKPESDVMPFEYDASAARLTVHAGEQEWIYDTAKGTVGTSSRPPMPPEDMPPPDRGADGAVSPDGKVKVVARDYNLYLVDIATKREVPLTSGGSYDVRYGMNYPMLGDMARTNSEPPPMPVAVQWSEDSRRILTYRLLRNNSYIWHGVQQTPPDSYFPRTFSYVYPSAGAKNVPQFPTYCHRCGRRANQRQSRYRRAEGSQSIDAVARRSLAVVGKRPRYV